MVDVEAQLRNQGNGSGVVLLGEAQQHRPERRRQVHPPLRMRRQQAPGFVPPALHPGPEEIMLGPGLVAHVYRTVQEALSNVFRHSRASEARLTLTYAADGFELVVEDNGRGFERERDGGRGLRHMRERAAAIRGEFSVASKPGGGTRLSLQAPYEVTHARDPRPTGG